MDRKLIIANWKSHKSEAEALQWLEHYRQQLGAKRHHARVVLSPAFSLLPLVSSFLEDHPLPETVVGVQDISPFPAGAYTGAVSSLNLKGFAVEYALVGHSERRRYFHETHQDVANKVDQALLAGITPVVCLDRDYIEAQANALDGAALAQCVVAYEPLEAIGSGQFEPVAEVISVRDQIRQVFGEVPIIYGGSVSAANVAEYLEVLDGVLVGSASLDAVKFAELLLAGA